MPKQFGHTVSVYVTLAIVISFTGCRTASTQLASVPGLGWLNRGDEGWAKYEPAPSLPRPSSTSEPTGLDSPASNIASNSPKPSSELGSTTRGYDTATSATGDLASKDRFDKRYIPKTDNSNAGSSNGDYASAYGKYGAPKSLASNKAQAAPYGGDIPKYEPKYASNSNTAPAKGYDTSTSYNNSFAGSKYVSPTSPKADEAPAEAAPAEEAKSPYGYVANNRFDSTPTTPTTSSPTATTPGSQFAAGGTSRFGTAPATTTPLQKYTPPGFASTNSNKSLGDQFGGVAANAQKEAANLANSASNQLANATNNTIAQGNKFAGGLTNTTTNSAKNFAANAQSNVNSAVNGLNPPGEFNRFADANKSLASNAASTANQAASSIANNAQSGVEMMSNGAAAITNKFSGGFRNQATNTAASAQSSAQQIADNVASALPTAAGTFNSASNAASSTLNNATTQASQYAQGAMNNVTAGVGAQVEKASQFASDTYNQFANGVTPALQGATTVPQQATQQLQGIATQAQQTIEKNVTSTYNQAKNNFEQTAASRYEEAKTSVGQYANTAVESVKNGAAGLTSGVDSNDTYKSATTKASEYLSAASDTVSQSVNNAGQTLQGYGTSAVKAAQNAMQNVSAPISPYPTTATPNPFVVPGNSISGSSRPPEAPATSAPGVFQNYDAQPTTSGPGPVHRTATPFLPGSTKSFQGATTARKPTIELASATKDDVSSEKARDEQLVLAVGDTSQFPLMLR